MPAGRWHRVECTQAAVERSALEEADVKWKQAGQKCKVRSVTRKKETERRTERSVSTGNCIVRHKSNNK